MSQITIMFVATLSTSHRGLRRYRSLLLSLLLLRRVAYFGFRELRRDRRSDKPRYEDPRPDLIRRIKVLQ